MTGYLHPPGSLFRQLFHLAKGQFEKGNSTRPLKIPAGVIPVGVIAVGFMFATGVGTAAVAQDKPVAPNKPLAPGASSSTQIALASSENPPTVPFALQNAPVAVFSASIAGSPHEPVSSVDSISSIESIPDAPQAQALPQTSPKVDRAPQTKRILGIIPNFRAVSTDQKLPPQSVKEKFVTATEDSFDYSSIVIPAVLAGYSLETNATPEFGSGGLGYARYLWHAAVDQTSENYMVEFVVPSLTREDTRFYTLGRGGFLKRAGYSLSRAVITRSDSGREVFNASEVIGAGASAGLSSLYYPSRERSFGNTGKEWGLDVGIDAAAFFVKEFWPDINHSIFHGTKPSAVPAP